MTPGMKKYISVSDSLVEDLRNGKRQPTSVDPNALNLFTSHCEPEGRGNLVVPGIASLSRHGGTPRHDRFFNAFVLVGS